jgi:hypothetical protein
MRRRYPEERRQARQDAGAVDGHAAERIADDLSAWLGLSALERKVVHA